MLVTGAAGFVGANLVRRLERDGVRVIAAVRPGGDPWRLEQCTAERLELDIEDAAAVRRAVTLLEPRVIYSLATHGAYSWQTDAERMARVNVLGVAALLTAAAEAGVDRLVHAGTSSEYGPKDHAPDEGEALDPTTAYGATKAGGTMLLRQAAARGGPVAVVLRLYSAYGPWEEPGRLIPALVTAASRGELPPLVDPATARDFVYVDDVVEAFVRAATRPVEPGAIFNVASGQQTTLAELVESTRRALGVTAAPSWSSMQPRPWDTDVWVGRCDRIRSALGWEARVTPAEGLQRTATWLAEHPELTSRYA